MTQETRRAGLAVVFITALIDSAGFGIVLPVLPRLIMDLSGVGIDRAAIYGGWLSFAYAVMQFLCAPILGNLSDRFGRRPVLLFALGALGVDYLIMGFAPALWWLFVGRTIAGTAGASFTPAAAYVADLSPPETRAQDFGLLGIAFGMGFILGPAIGGVLGTIGPRAPFFAAGAMALGNAAFGYFALPESLAPHLRRPLDWARANPVGTLAQIKRYPSVAWIVLAVFVWQLASQSLPSTWAYYTTAKFHWSAAQIGYSLTFAGLTGVIAQPLLKPSRLRRLGGERGATELGILFGCLAYIGYALVPRGWMTYAVSLLNVLFALAYPCMNSLMSRQVPADAQGELQGAVACVSSLSAVIGPPVMTAVFGYCARPAAMIHFQGAAFIVAALLTVVCAVLYEKGFRAASRLVAPQASEIQAQG
jgi:MFS transporter, DHA1 family, tetracycline resistance protein